MKKFQITLNEKQLLLIANCIEDCSRFMAGETDMANCTSNLKHFGDIRKELRNITPYIVPELVEKYGQFAYYPWNGGECPNMAQRKFIAESYYLYREMLHVYTVCRGINNVYSSPTLRCADSGEPIEIKEL